MKYSYHNPYFPVKWITLNRACPDWFNQDLPEIYDENGVGIFSSDLNGVYAHPEYYDRILKFLVASDLAFHRKYKSESWCKPVTRKESLAWWSKQLKTF